MEDRDLFSGGCGMTESPVSTLFVACVRACLFAGAQVR